MKKDSKESTQRQLRYAIAKHQEFCGLLEAEERKRSPNHIEVTRLKKEKLRYKDRRTELEQKLEILSAPPKRSADVIPLPAPQLELAFEAPPARRVAMA